MRPNDKDAPFKAGLHAERIQWRKIVDERLPAKSIPQDIRTYIRDFGHLAYTVKRGDFIIWNIELEVKCRAFKRSRIGVSLSGLFFFDSIIAVILDLKIIKDVLNSFLL